MECFISCMFLSFCTSHFITACYRSTILSHTDSFTLDRYVHEYQLSPVHGVALLSSSLCILDAPTGKVGFYLRYLVWGLRLPPTSFFLDVLCFYVIHLFNFSPMVCQKSLLLRLYVCPLAFLFVCPCFDVFIDGFFTNNPMCACNPRFGSMFFTIRYTTLWAQEDPWHASRYFEI